MLIYPFLVIIRHLSISVHKELSFKEIKDKIKKTDSKNLSKGRNDVAYKRLRVYNVNK